VIEFEDLLPYVAAFVVGMIAGVLWVRLKTANEFVRCLLYLIDKNDIRDHMNAQEIAMVDYIAGRMNK